MDYVTIPGISTRTGVEETELTIFIVKELVDNALDFVEKNTAVKNNNKKDNELSSGTSLRSERIQSTLR